jgi:pilus assembly protein FimV
MIITCDNCNTSFELDDNQVKDSGSKVRCTNCDHVFVAHPPEGAKEPEAVEIPNIELEDTLEIQGDDEEPELVIEFETEDEPAPGAPEDQRDPTDPEPELMLEMETGDSSDDLDISDIEKMLDGDLSGEEPEPVESDGEEPELELSMDTEETAEEENLFEDELDLSDIEKLLEMDDEEMEMEEGTVSDDVELTLDQEPETEPDEDDLSLELDQEPGDLDDLALDLELESDDDLQLELDDSEDLILDLDEDDVDIETVEAEGDFDLDLDAVDEEPEEESAPEARQPVAAESPTISEPPSKKEAFAMGAEDGTGKDQKSQTEPETKTPAFTPSLPIPKKSSKAPVMVLVLLLLLAGISAAYYFMIYKGQTLVGGKIGEIAPLEETFKYKFIDNTRVGKLFVVTGIVENKFDHARRHIQVSGELLAEGANVVQHQKAYCGNVIREMKLSTLDMNGINRYLSKMAGDNQSNMNVKPGAKIPFMVIFSNLPDNIEEYRIQIEGSVPAEK